jgi:DNA primase
MQASDEIKQKLDIVDVVKGYMPLQQAGMNFRACCPFHREKTPSFMVSPDKQIYHCFGCGKGGDLISFVMGMEGVDFVEALRILAPKAGVMLKRQDPKITSKRNKLLDIMDLSSKYYYKVLIDTDKAKFAREYLKDRGMLDETIDEWRIGYSFDAWDNLSNFLKKKGFNDAELFAAGVVSRSSSGQKYFDRFRDRVMFPISDVNGNVVAFSARINPIKEKTEKMGKYINSPQTFLYDKSKILFGLDRARTEIRKMDYAIIVEGQMDVITAHQAGFKNVVASSGTALTTDQVALLKRYSKNIKLAFDMDKAGEMAADRGIREAMKAGMNIKVIEVPNGKDPDECINNDIKEWALAVKNSKPMMQYYIDKKVSEIDISDINKVEDVKKFIFFFLSKISAKIEQDHWIKYLSQKTNSREESLREDFQKYTEENLDKKSVKKEVVQNMPKMVKLSKADKLSELFIAIILKYFYLFDYLSDKIEIKHISGESSKAIYKKLLMYYNNITKRSLDNINVFNYNDFKSWISTEFGDNENIRGDQFANLDKLVILGDKEFSDIETIDAKAEIIRLFTSLKKIYFKAEMYSLERKISELEKKGNKEELHLVLEELKKMSDELLVLDKIN